MKAKGKVNPPKKKPQPERDGREWQRLYAEMRKERNRLRKELAAVKKERDAYLKSLYALMRDDEVVDFTKEEVFAQMGRKPSLKEFIAELEARGVA